MRKLNFISKGGIDMTIPIYPKIFAIGTQYIQTLFNDSVRIEEKLDGSFMGFGVVNDTLCFRSKGKQIYPESCDKLFAPGIEYICSIEDKLRKYPNTIFYCEYMRKPKHNTIKYDRIPKNHLMLFGIADYLEPGGWKFRVKDFEKFADFLDIDSVPLLAEGKFESFADLKHLMDTESFCGGSKIEGLVVKNYNNPFLLGGQPIPFMAGKYVSEEFKEVHNKNWKGHKGKSKWAAYCESFRTEARWNKAIQHLRDNGELEIDPSDIGKLIKEVQNDIKTEEEENIKEQLWKFFGKDVLRYSTRGLPEWYKEKLIGGSVDWF